MDDNINFKELWSNQNTSQPKIDELYSRLKKYRSRSMRKLIVSNILLIATSVFIAWVWYHYQPQFISTKIGCVLVILAMAIFLIVYNQLIPSFNKLENAESNSDYLKHLIAIKSKQHFLETTILNLYYVLLSTGLCLYMYEPTLAMTTANKILAYALTFAWVGFSWFYIRPKNLKKQQGKLDEMIGRFESVNRQLDDD